MRKDSLGLLAKLTSIQSYSLNELRIGNYLYDFIKKVSGKVHKQKVASNRFNIIAEKGTGKASIVLYAHLDTIAVTNGWKSNPLLLKVIGNRAYGLGSWDMKAGIVANIITFLKTNPKNYKLKLLFCVDEENISEGAYQFIKSPFIDGVSCVISTEPSFQHGLQGIVTGRVGRAVYEVFFSGISKHFAFYNKSFDINLAVGKFLAELEKMTDLSNNQFVFARKIHSGAIGLSLPDSTVMELDSATMPPSNHSEILRELINIADGIKKRFGGLNIKVNFKKRLTPFLESYRIDNHNKYLQSLRQSVYVVTGKSAHPYCRRSVADENVFGFNKIPILGIGPEGGNAHAPNEWVNTASIDKLSKILLHFLAKFDRA